MGIEDFMIDDLRFNPSGECAAPTLPIACVGNDSMNQWPDVSILLKRGILEPVRLSVQLGREQDLGIDLFPLGVLDDHLHGELPHPVGKLDGIGVDLAFLDRLLAEVLTVEGDDLDLVRLVGLLQRGVCTQRRGIVDREDSREVGIGLQRILGCLVPLVPHAAAGQRGDHRDPAIFAVLVVGVDDLVESLHAQLARLGLLKVEDGDLAAGFAERLDHHLSRLLAAAVVVGGDVADHLGARIKTGDVDGEDRDARLVGLLDGGSDGPRVAGAQHDGRDLLDNEVLDLVLLDMIKMDLMKICG